jgi:thiamine kinase-like enzyme
MTSRSDLERQLTNVSNDSARALNLRTFSTNMNLNATKSDGFLGEFYKVSITDSETHTTHDLVVKRAPTENTRRQLNNAEWAYKNEIHFYTQIYPAFKKFEEGHRVQKRFNSLPEFITCDKEVGREMIVLRDLTKMGFEMRRRDLLLDDEHARLIFKTYGHFHANSFCLREQVPEEFDRLAKPLYHIWKNFANNDGFINLLTKLAENAYEGLDSARDAVVLEKLKKYIESTKEIFQEALAYDGKYLAILHGDCWSNNMMFKYQEQKSHSPLVGMNLLDFQLVATGTPVYDLSYFFYTGGSKELFDKLNDYLNIYYDSFSNSVRSLGNDPNEIFPREILNQEWKRFSRFGMMLSMLLTKTKLISTVGTNTQSTKSILQKRLCDIVIHMHEIDAL